MCGHGQSVAPVGHRTRVPHNLLIMTAVIQACRNAIHSQRIPPVVHRRQRRRDLDCDGARHGRAGDGRSY